MRLWCRTYLTLLWVKYEVWRLKRRILRGLKTKSKISVM